MITTKIELAKDFALNKFNKVGKRNHFLEVFQILHKELEIENEATLIASLLHDTLEDTDTTYEEIETTFSKEVADLVREVSHPKDYNDQQRIEYYKKILTISNEGKMIKIADFISHMRNFINIYERNDQHLFPKFINNNKYVANIEEFLEGCSNSKGKEILSALVKKLKGHL